MVSLGDTQQIQVEVPNERPLTIPGGFAEHQSRFEPALQILTDGLTHDEMPATVERQLADIPDVPAADAARLRDTFVHLKRLYEAGRDGIWPYVMRNLQRPLWLSRPAQRADAIIGNPPWVAYRYLSAEMKGKVVEASRRRGIWVGGVLATQFDLSALFMARVVELYLKEAGTIGFVLPYAALNRPAFAGLRAGDFAVAKLRIDVAWSFDETVKPLFPVPACVLIGRRAESGPLPKTVTRYEGVLHRRDATEAEADMVLRYKADRWPPMPTMLGVSPYRARFKQGATIVPRRFFLVAREEGGRLGVNVQAPLVKGIAGKLDRRLCRT